MVMRRAESRLGLNLAWPVARLVGLQGMAFLLRSTTVMNQLSQLECVCRACRISWVAKIIEVKILEFSAVFRCFTGKATAPQEPPRPTLDDLFS